MHSAHCLSDEYKFARIAELQRRIDLINGRAAARWIQLADQILLADARRSQQHPKRRVAALKAWRTRRLRELGKEAA